MKTFRFGLQRLLEHRQRIEDDRAADLARARAEAEAARKNRDRLLQLIRESRGVMEGTHRTGTAGVLQNLAFVLSRLEERALAADSVCREREAEVEQTSEAFRAAVRDRDALTRIRERRETEWREEGLRKEQGELDEMATLRHARGDHDSRRAG